MKLGLIRHGQTAWNALGRIQGQTDIPLNEDGVQQARLLGERLRKDNEQWDYVITSDLQRARRTGEIIAQRLQIPIAPPDPRLRERYFGDIEGTTAEERMCRWGSDWRKTADAGQETDLEVRARGMAFIRDLLAQHPNASVLVVSHGSFLAQLMQEMCQELQDSHLSNLSYSVLKHELGKWQPVLHNCTRHLLEQ